jgi:NTE family protein
VGLALGSGSARGWAHIGVIHALERAKIRPDIVCGTSIGALVGAAYAAGELDRLEQWALGLRKRDVASLMDIGPGAGLLRGKKLLAFFRDNVEDRALSDLDTPFATVATSLQTGAEVWLRDGSMLDAVWASIALPGLLPPVERDGSLLVDGGLVNPVPVSLGRAMGADVLIAVDLGSDISGRLRRNETQRKGLRVPAVVDVVQSSITIMQVRIARSRMAGEPADVVVAPRLGHLGLLDFQEARQAIEEGEQAVARIADALSSLDLGTP